MKRKGHFTPPRTPKKHKQTGRKFTKRSLTKLARKYSNKIKPRRVRMKRPAKSFIANDLHSGITYAPYSAVQINKPIAGVMHKGGYNHYVEQYGIRTGSQEGAQGVYDVAIIGTVNQWLAGSGSQDFGANPDKSYLNYFALNPYRILTGSDWFNFAANAKPAQDRYALVSTEVTMEMTNLGSTAMVVEFLVCRSKVPQKSNAGTTWTNCIKEYALGQPNAIPNVAGSAVSGTAGVPNPNMISMKPQILPSWRKQWQVLETKHIDLAAAACGIVKIDLNMNQLGAVDNFITINGGALTADPTTWTAANITVPYPKGCVDILMIIHGQVVSDTTLGAVAANGNSTIGLVVTKSNKFKPVYANAARIITETMLLGQPNGAIPAAQKDVDMTDQIGSYKSA